MAEEIKVQPEEIIAEQPKPRCWDKINPPAGGHKFKILVGFLGVLVFAGAVFGAYKLGQRQLRKIITSTPPTSDFVSDWKTYRNEEYGFEFKYPPTPDWEISKEIDTPLVVHVGPEWCITVFEYAKNPRSLSVKEFCEEQYKDVILEEAPYGDDPCWHILYKESKPLNMGGKEALQVRRVGGPLATTVTFISIDNFILAISKIESDYAGYDGKCGLLNTDKVYNQILSTFKFLEGKESIRQKVFCKDSRPEVCTMECIVNPPYICGSNGKSYCNVCGACADPDVGWYIIQDTPCKP